MKKPLVARVLSHKDYNELIASIECDGQEVAIISQDRGPEQLEIFLFQREDALPWRFSYADFEAAVREAKTKLIQKKG